MFIIKDLLIRCFEAEKNAVDGKEQSCDVMTAYAVSVALLGGVSRGKIDSQNTLYSRYFASLLYGVPNQKLITTTQSVMDIQRLKIEEAINSLADDKEDMSEVQDLNLKKFPDTIGTEVL